MWVVVHNTAFIGHMYFQTHSFINKLRAPTLLSVNSSSEAYVYVLNCDHKNRLIYGLLAVETK